MDDEAAPGVEAPRDPRDPRDPAQGTVQPLALPMLRIVEIGLACWLVALVVTLVVPALHDGTRSWWPWCCVVGLVLGSIGVVYLRRGRGNAAEA
ncbi:MAG: DUF2530 domain-containing protein [Lapillicoccus sp.]